VLLVTDQQSAEVETSRNEVEAALVTVGRVEYDLSKPVQSQFIKSDCQELCTLVRALAQRIETLTRERDDALGVQAGYISPVQKVLEERARAERAEAQRDRLADALEAIADEDFFLTWADAVKCARAALSEIEQAASEESLSEKLLALSDRLKGPLTSSFDHEIAMELRALATGDHSEIEARDRRIEQAASNEGGAT
jgi:hypothetical protein